MVKPKSKQDRKVLVAAWLTREAARVRAYNETHKEPTIADEIEACKRAYFKSCTQEVRTGSSPIEG
jgi:hypothetical protein